jgi:hypothetical protein
MSTISARSVEPLYIIIVREKNGQQLLQQWAKTQSVNVSIDTNRMKVFDARAFHLFQLNWAHSWENVTIWDCWLRRHIYSN